jgi:predicted glutamine amidotransferase
MCIIAYSPYGERIKKSILKQCFAYHGDGAGIMVRDEDGWIAYSKGLMSFTAFYSEYREILSQFPECEYALHFRTGTSGLNELGCTHPFPLSNEETELNRLEGFVEYAMMHNGIVGRGEECLSDTQVYVRDYLYPLRDVIDDERVQELIETHIGDYNKFLIMTRKDTHLIGNWIEDNEIWYSNRDFEERVIVRDWRNYILNNDWDEKKSWEVLCEL